MAASNSKAVAKAMERQARKLIKEGDPQGSVLVITHRGERVPVSLTSALAETLALIMSATGEEGGTPARA